MESSYLLLWYVPRLEPASVATNMFTGKEFPDNLLVCQDDSDLGQNVT